MDGEKDKNNNITSGGLPITLVAPIEKPPAKGIIAACVILLFLSFSPSII